MPGRVILQTYNPDHFSILSAKKQDYNAFYEREIGFRKSLRYPPFSRLLQIKISGKDKEKTGARARELGEYCSHLRTENPDYNKSIDVLGPIEAPLPRIADRHRWQILIKGAGVQPIHQFIHTIMKNHPVAFSGSHPSVILDVDPYDML
jgi:primosomal protein N' (replication factor Y)